MTVELRASIVTERAIRQSQIAGAGAWIRRRGRGCLTRHRHSGQDCDENQKGDLLGNHGTGAITSTSHALRSGSCFRKESADHDGHLAWPRQDWDADNAGTHESRLWGEGAHGGIREIRKYPVYAKIEELSVLELRAAVVGRRQEGRIAAKRPHMNDQSEPWARGSDRCAGEACRLAPRAR